MESKDWYECALIAGGAQLTKGACLAHNMAEAGARFLENNLHFMPPMAAAASGRRRRFQREVREQ